MMRIAMSRLPSLSHAIYRMREDCRVTFDTPIDWWAVPPDVVDDWLVEAWEHMTFGGIGGMRSPIIWRLIGGTLNRRLVPAGEVP